jgi:AbrB family looped-hinge helix DNA binding protein
MRRQEGPSGKKGEAAEMNKALKILGVKGRITIPYAIREMIGFRMGDIVSFETDGGSITIKKEKLCDGCWQRASPPAGVLPEPDEEEITLTEYLDSLTYTQQMAALAYLSSEWAGRHAGGDKDGCQAIPNRP